MAQQIARHILSFAQTMAGGGVERALLRLAGLWVADGRRVTIVIGSGEGPLANEIPAGVEIVTLGDARYTALARGVPAIVRERRPDVLFCPGNHYSAVAAWTRVRLGRACPPIVGKVSNALARRDMGVTAPGYAAWLRLHPRFFDAVVAMTPGMAEEAVRTMRIAPARVHVIANPPALPRGGMPTPKVPAGRYLIGVGRLAPQKRWDRAIAALARIADQQVPLLILGEGNLRRSLEALARSLGLSDRVILPGHAPDPLATIGGAALLVLTSDYEGVPGVLREALALGTPVVTTDSSVAVREIVTSDDQGSIVPRDDADALVAAIDHWLKPERSRPSPVTASGDPAAAYVELFDSLSSPDS